MFVMSLFVDFALFVLSFFNFDARLLRIVFYVFFRLNFGDSVQMLYFTIIFHYHFTDEHFCFMLK